MISKTIISNIIIQREIFKVNIFIKKLNINFKNLKIADKKFIFSILVNISPPMTVINNGRTK